MMYGISSHLNAHSFVHSLLRSVPLLLLLLLVALLLACVDLFLSTVTTTNEQQRQQRHQLSSVSLSLHATNVTCVSRSESHARTRCRIEWLLWMQSCSSVNAHTCGCALTLHLQLHPRSPDLWLEMRLRGYASITARYQ